MDTGKRDVNAVDVPLRNCGWCKLNLNPGQAHLSRDVCIKELQDAFVQAVALANRSEQIIGNLKTTNRLAWIMINELDGKVRTFTKEQLNMPPVAKITAEMTDAGMVVRAVTAAPQPGVPS